MYFLDFQHLKTYLWVVRECLQWSLSDVKLPCLEETTVIALHKELPDKQLSSLSFSFRGYFFYHSSVNFCYFLKDHLRNLTNQYTIFKKCEIYLYLITLSSLRTGKSNSKILLRVKFLERSSWRCAYIKEFIVIMVFWRFAFLRAHCMLLGSVVAHN